MNVTQSRVRHLFVSVLLCVMSAGSVFAVPKVLTPAALAAALNTETPGQALLDGKMLTFRQKSIRLVVETGPKNDMLSYRIEGKRNPTLVLTRGAAVKMLFINTDDDMTHNIRFGRALKTYPNLMSGYLKSSIGTSELPHKSSSVFYGEEVKLPVPAKPGAYAYFCTVRGHAQGGMVGKVIVR